MLKNMPVSTVLMLVMITAGLGFSVAGFANAPNSQMPVALVTSLMLVGAASFAIAGVLGLSQKTRWVRFVAVASLAATAYLIFMAVVYFSILSSIVTEF